MALDDKAVNLRDLKVSHDDLDGKVTDLKSDLQQKINIETVVNGAFNPSSFINGGLTRGVITNAQYRAVSKNPMRYTTALRVTPTDTYRFGVHTYNDNGEFVADSNWKTSAYVIPANTSFRIIIAKRTEDTSEVADIATFVSQLSIVNVNNEAIGNGIVSLQEQNTVYNSIGSEYLGDARCKNISIPAGTQKKKVLTLNLLSDTEYTVNFKLSSALGGNTYIYVLDESGVNILSNSKTISGTLAEYSFSFTAANDYKNASIAYTSNYNATIESVSIKSVGKFGQFTRVFSPVIIENNCTSARMGEKNVLPYPSIYSADSISITSNGTRWSGLNLNIYNPPIDSVITVIGTRTGGNDNPIRIDFFNASGTRIGSEKWGANKVSRVTPSGAYRCEITLAASWGTALSSGDEVTFSDVKVYYSALETLEESVYGTGNIDYTGERIVIEDDTRNNKANIALWKDFKSSEISSLANYRLDKNQSMTIFNGYVFLFQQGGQVLILDYATKAILSESGLTPTADQHANSAQFSDIYHSDSDEFPLLLLSRCGNASEGKTGLDEVQIYRVTRSGTSFTFTLINIVYSDYPSKGNSWGIDNVTNTLYMVGSKSGWWESGDKSDVEFFAWNMPSKADILSGTSITLTTDSAIAHMSIPFITLQGISINGNMLYCGFSVNGQKVYAVDVFKNRVCSIVPLTSSLEVEGVAVYDGKIYVSQKNGSDTEGTNPCQIYELTF